MAAPFNKILSKAEDAIAARLALVATESGIASGSIHCGGAPITEDVALPSATVVATTAQPNPRPATGCWDVALTVEIHTAATEARAAHEATMRQLQADAELAERQHRNDLQLEAERHREAMARAAQLQALPPGLGAMIQRPASAPSQREAFFVGFLAGAVAAGATFMIRDWWRSKQQRRR
jgi:hypothetical protein